MKKIEKMVIKDVMKLTFLKDLGKQATNSKRILASKIGGIKDNELLYQASKSYLIGYVTWFISLSLMLSMLAKTIAELNLPETQRYLAILGLIYLFIIIVMMPISETKSIEELFGVKRQNKKFHLEIVEGDKEGSNRESKNKTTASFLKILFFPLILVKKILEYPMDTVPPVLSRVFEKWILFIFRFHGRKIHALMENIKKEIKRLEDFAQYLKEEIQVLEDKLIKRDSSLQTIFEENNDLVIASLPTVLVVTTRLFIHPWIKNFDAFTRGSSERLILTSMTGNHQLDFIKHEKKPREQKVLGALLDSVTSTRHFVSNEFLLLMKEVISELKNNPTIDQELLLEVLNDMEDKWSTLLNHVNDNLFEFIKLLKKLQEDPASGKDASKFSRDVSWLKSKLSSGKASEYKLKQEVQKNSEFNGTKEDFLRYLAFLDDEILVVSTPHGTYYFRRQKENNLMKQMMEDKHPNVSLETLIELNYLTDHELLVRRKIIENLLKKFETIKDSISPRVLEQARSRLNEKLSLTREILLHREKTISEIMMETRACVYCKVGKIDTSGYCEVCFRKETQCFYCHHPINVDEEEYLQCPKCERSFHSEELLSTINKSGECPICNAKLRIVPTTSQK